MSIKVQKVKCTHANVQCTDCENKSLTRCKTSQRIYRGQTAHYSAQYSIYFNEWVVIFISHHWEKSVDFYLGWYLFNIYAKLFCLTDCLREVGCCTSFGGFICLMLSRIQQCCISSAKSVFVCLIKMTLPA